MKTFQLICTSLLTTDEYLKIEQRAFWAVIWTLGEIAHLYKKDDLEALKSAEQEKINELANSAQSLVVCLSWPETMESNKHYAIELELIRYGMTIRRKTLLL